MCTELHEARRSTSTTGKQSPEASDSKMASGAVSGRGSLCEPLSAFSAVGRRSARRATNTARRCRTRRNKPLSFQLACHYSRLGFQLGRPCSRSPLSAAAARCRRRWLYGFIRECRRGGLGRRRWRRGALKRDAVADRVQPRRTVRVTEGTAEVFGSLHLERGWKILRKLEAKNIDRFPK